MVTKLSEAARGKRRPLQRSSSNAMANQGPQRWGFVTAVGFKGHTIAQSPIRLAGYRVGFKPDQRLGMPWIIGCFRSALSMGPAADF